jgi:glycerol uptake facilitator-like aquaporin
VIAGKMRSSVSIGYVTVQFLAAVLACACVVSQLPASMQEKIIEAGAAPGLPSPIDEHSSASVMLNSIMGSMCLCFLYMSAYLNRDFDMELAPACFAMGYAALTIIGVGLTGGNFNPVSMLPGLFYPDFSDKQMVLCLSPWLGSAMGCLLYGYFLAKEDPKEFFAEDEDK